MHWYCRRPTSTQSTWQQTRYFNVDFDSNGLFFSFLYISEKQLQFRKKQKHLLEKIFNSPHASNQIYLLWNCFSNYVYLKDMHITLKEIVKIMFVWVLRVLLICKFLNFTAAFTKKKDQSFQRLYTIFRVRKLISVLYVQLILPFIAFEEQY